MTRDSAYGSMKLSRGFAQKERKKHSQAGKQTVNSKYVTTAWKRKCVTTAQKRKRILRDTGCIFQP